MTFVRVIVVFCYGFEMIALDFLSQESKRWSILNLEWTIFDILLF
jgi:hypothetical protein